ncbi:hypothetical protein D9619_013298 [Psilocybe cf. subviscida]|uniref:F-box domain-containing protein n=1 Tax=Psilocybe cf. subviscida TaxID=2480587 RepID=A0A8H5BSH7_9AGAR|nr:hypothetical protein D9619_013298 [Psilocybe cf. subviscida]
MHWDVNQPDISIPSDSFLFMHAGITSLEFYLQSSLPLSQTREFLDDIPQRTPFLTAINVRTAVRVAELEGNICTLLDHLPRLQLISLPKNYLTSRIATALSTSPALRALQIGTTWDRGVNVVAPVVPAGGFLSLNKLEVVMPFADAALRIDAVTTGSALDELLISSPNRSSDDMKRILDICANKHRRIRQLNLECYDNEERSSLNFQTFHSLKKLSSLTSINIIHRSPMVMSPAEFTSIISSLTQLTRLCFNQSPLYCETASFGLDILPIIARSCKNLTTLKLFLDARLPLPEEEPHTRESLFVNLRCLSLGVSVITEETCHPAAMFLSTYLPLECELDHGADWVSELRRTG